MDRARRRKKKERRRKRRDEKEAKAKAKEEEKSIRGRLNPKHSRHVPSNRNSSNVGAGGGEGHKYGRVVAHLLWQKNGTVLEKDGRRGITRIGGSSRRGV